MKHSCYQLNYLIENYLPLHNFTLTSIIINNNNIFIKLYVSKSVFICVYICMTRIQFNTVSLNIWARMTVQSTLIVDWINLSLFEFKLVLQTHTNFKFCVQWKYQNWIYFLLGIFNSNTIRCNTVRLLVWTSHFSQKLYRLTLVSSS